MILTLNNKIIRYILVGACLFYWCLPSPSLAQNSIVLSVAPTLVELGTQPGELWQSSVRVINSNPFALTVYGNLVNFTPQGEDGRGIFVPVVPEETQGATLAEWVTLDEPAVTIPAGSSRNVAFTVRVPEDAAPGSHFAALQISTQPPTAATAETGLQTAQIVSSLFFIRVSGDIKEIGDIRSFTAENSLTAVPATDIELRFENKGNVHLQPQGDIIIRNMWGAERGRIPVNFNTSFGNALPGLIRRYEFAWQGTPSFFDIGLYSAEATLAYGQEGRQFLTQKTRFWVIPLMAIIITLGILLTIGLFLYWMVRSYVERMFALAGIDPVAIKGFKQTPKQRHAIERGDMQLNLTSVTAPVLVGYRDLVRHLQTGAALHRRGREVWLFLKEYRHFVAAIAGIVLLILFCVFIVSYLKNDDVAYVATVGSDANAVVYDSEVLAYIELTGQPLPQSWEVDTDPVRVINASGEVGYAASLATKIPAQYTVVDLGTERLTRTSTIITFPPAMQATALTLSEALGNVLLSADPEADMLTLIVGSER